MPCYSTALLPHIPDKQEGTHTHDCGAPRNYRPEFSLQEESRDQRKQMLTYKMPNVLHGLSTPNTALTPAARMKGNSPLLPSSAVPSHSAAARLNLGLSASISQGSPRTPTTRPPQDSPKRASSSLLFCPDDESVKRLSLALSRHLLRRGHRPISQTKTLKPPEETCAGLQRGSIAGTGFPPDGEREA